MSSSSLISPFLHCVSLVHRCLPHWRILMEYQVALRPTLQGLNSPVCLCVCVCVRVRGETRECVGMLRLSILWEREPTKHRPLSRSLFYISLPLHAERLAGVHHCPHTRARTHTTGGAARSRARSLKARTNVGKTHTSRRLAKSRKRFAFGVTCPRVDIDSLCQ